MVRGSQVGTKIHQKSMKKRIGNGALIGMDFGWLLGRILVDFWCKLGAKIGVKTRKNEVPKRFEKMTEKLTKKKSCECARVCASVRGTGGGSPIINQSRGSRHSIGAFYHSTSCHKGTVADNKV